MREIWNVPQLAVDGVRCDAPTIARIYNNGACATAHHRLRRPN
jgi:hypothetical protein